MESIRIHSVTICLPNSFESIQIDYSPNPMGELKVVPNPRLSQSLPLIFTCDDSKDAKSRKDVLWGYKKLTMTFNPCLGPPNVNFWRKSGLFDRKPLTMGTLISKLPFTGSAVALHCCKAHERINRKTGNSTPL